MTRGSRKPEKHPSFRILSTRDRPGQKTLFSVRVRFIRRVRGSTFRAAWDLNSFDLSSSRRPWITTHWSVPEELESRQTFNPYRVEGRFPRHVRSGHSYLPAYHGPHVARSLSSSTRITRSLSVSPATLVTLVGRGVVFRSVYVSRVLWNRRGGVEPKLRTRPGR